MEIKQMYLPDQIRESYKRLVVEQEDGGITGRSMDELLDLLTYPGAFRILKRYVYGGMQTEFNVK